MHKIKRLPLILANQIAAGEVVERPASVVKELVENSIDAGATQIEINIEKGGHKQILVRDNGHGIEKDQLTLALSRHATSKIATLDDLENIASLGFRGEAMASISSVARLTLTSNTSSQNQGWQAFAEGSEMDVKIAPCAHPLGTSVLVEDLFFNTPARRKFLKSEKTEFTHIESLITRISLANSHINFVLRHNGKRIKQFTAANTKNEQLKRVQEACGSKFENNAHQVKSDYHNIHLSGWINLNAQLGAPIEHQYFFVNGRTVRDKLVQHALRQACTEHAPNGLALNYVLFLCLPAEQVDVNVHPAKHEVRFHQAKIIHDFIVNSLLDALSQAQQPQKASVSTAKPAETLHDYISAPRTTNLSNSSRVSEAATSTYQPKYNKLPNHNHVAVRQYQHLLMTHESEQQSSNWSWFKVGNTHLLIRFNDHYWITKTGRLVAPYLKQKLMQEVVSQPLLIPISVALSHNDKVNRTFIDGFKPFGFDLSVHKNKLIIKSVPAGLREFDWASIWLHIVDQIHEISPTNALDILLNQVEATHISFTPSLLNSSFEWLTHLKFETSISLLDTQANAIDLVSLLDQHIE